MRYLVHVVGDVHQPLHASSLFNDRFPKGDQGGNLFLIKLDENIDELHKLFDSGANKLGDTITRVLHKFKFIILLCIKFFFITLYYFHYIKFHFTKF